MEVTKEKKEIMTQLEKWIQPTRENHHNNADQLSQTPYQCIGEMENQIKEIRAAHLKTYGWNFRYEKTAITRKTVTAPLRNVLKQYDFVQKVGIDFGCGQAMDAEYLNQHGSTCWAYDYFFKPLQQSQITPENPNDRVDYVLLFYVLNILPPRERVVIANTAIKCVKRVEGTIFVAVREDEYSIQPSWEKWEDGYMTTNKTFQWICAQKALVLSQLQTLFSTCSIIPFGQGLYRIQQ